MSSSSANGNNRGSCGGSSSYLCCCGKRLKDNNPFSIIEHEKSEFHTRWAAVNDDKKVAKLTTFFSPVAKRRRATPEEDESEIEGGESRARAHESSSSSSSMVTYDTGGANISRGSDVAQPPTATPCPGFMVEGIPSHRQGGNFIDNYPTRLPDRPWRVDTEGTAWSLLCQKTSNAGAACAECERIPFTREWKGMVKCCQRVAREGPGRVPNQFLSRMAVEAKLVEVTAERDQLRLRGLNNARKTLTLEKGLSTYQRFARCVATRDVKRTRQIVDAELRRGRSIKAVTEVLEAAAEGVYSRKKWEQEEKEFCCFVALVGGARLMGALKDHVGLASYSTVRRMARTHVVFDVCHRGIDEDIVAANIRSAFVGRGFRPRLLALDEVAATPGLDVDLKTNSITGVCYEHSAGVNFEFSSASAFDLVLQEVTADEVATPHLAKEVLVMCVQGLGRSEYEATPVCGLGTCKKGSPRLGMETLRVCIDVWKRVGEATYGPLWGVASDGDPKRRQGATDDLSSHEFEGDFAAHLVGLRGLDSRCSREQLVWVPDIKHLLKRFRNALISLDRHVHIGDLPLTVVELRELLNANGVPGVRTLLEATDRMNVPAATGLLQGIADADLEKMPTRHGQLLRKHVAVLQVVCRLLLAPFDSSMNLADHLLAASTLAHLVGFLFDLRGIHFVPSMWYNDLQAWTKAVFVFAARGKVWGADFELFVHQPGTDAVENLFRQTRTSDHSTTFSTVAFQSKLTIAAQVDALLSRHPEWKGRNRRDGPGQGCDAARPRHFTRSYACTEVSIHILPLLHILPILPIGALLRRLFRRCLLPILLLPLVSPRKRNRKKTRKRRNRERV
eukprot:GHVU01100228.1.p1 GENE.GHVU01100228.1~~GHVU01100228.1.p1  ORF type:complete len:846 (+),score=72.09 GHVU01100228.1:656-3193(+)